MVLIEARHYHQYVNIYVNQTTGNHLFIDDEKTQWSSLANVQGYVDGQPK